MPTLMIIDLGPETVRVGVRSWDSITNQGLFIQRMAFSPPESVFTIIYIELTNERC